MSKRRVGVIGAGPGGLTLARILHMSGLEVSVFERETGMASRAQGGSLDMHVESGQFALECAGLTKEFKSRARYQDQEGRIYDKNGVLRFCDTEVEGKDRPEIDRGQLRKLLADSLPAGLIHWDHKLRSLQSEDGYATAIFENGRQEQFDLVVGADGAWSRVRPSLSAAQPSYSGVLFVELAIDPSDDLHDEVAKLVGHGMSFALGDSKAIIGHRDDNAHLTVYAAIRAPENWSEEKVLDQSSCDSMRNSLSAHFGDWSELFQRVIKSSRGTVNPRGIYALPIGHRWEHKAQVTIIGDAAHLMSPFGGNGANLAMQDGAELALALLNQADWDLAVSQFEMTMFERAEIAARGAHEGMDEVFSPDGLAHALRQFAEHALPNDAMRN